MGALVDPVQKQRIEGLVAQGVEQGAAKWQPDIVCPTEGCFYPPTLLTDVGPANIVVTDEIFGPVLAVMSFRHLSEALALANNSRYGLSATVWTENINRAMEVATQSEGGRGVDQLHQPVRRRVRLRRLSRERLRPRRRQGRPVRIRQAEERMGEGRRGVAEGA